MNLADFDVYPSLLAWHLRLESFRIWKHVTHVDTRQTIDMCDMFYMCFQMQKLSIMNFEQESLPTI